MGRKSKIKAARRYAKIMPLLRGDIHPLNMDSNIGAHLSHLYQCLKAADNAQKKAKSQN